MRVVIAGSSGLIGTALVSSLRSDNHDVVRLVRRSTAGPDESRWDPDHDRLDLSILQGADAVVNHCGVGIGDKRAPCGRDEPRRPPDRTVGPHR